MQQAPIPVNRSYEVRNVEARRLKAKLSFSGHGQPLAVRLVPAPSRLA